jgi:hypothetical protein
MWSAEHDLDVLERVHAATSSYGAGALPLAGWFGAPG